MPDGSGKGVGRRDVLHHGPTPRALSHVPQPFAPSNAASSLLHAAIGAWQPNNASPNVAARRRATEGGVMSHTTRRQSSLFPHKPTGPRPTPRRPTEIPSVGEAEALSPGRPTAIEQLSRIPREFFILETNAVLPHAQYPPSQYQSTFVPGAGLWETIVFPALAPHTRQQVLYLAQTVERLRVQTLGHMAVGGITDNKSSRAMFLQDAALVTQYAEKEWALYSMCYHELVRQIKFICREQGELLRETHERYDAIVRRLLDLAAAAVERIRECPIDGRTESRSLAESDSPEFHVDALQSAASDSPASRERSAERISRSRHSRSGHRHRGSALNADDDRGDCGFEWKSDGDDDDLSLDDDDAEEDDDASGDDADDRDKEEQRVKREQQRRRRLMTRWGQHERQSRISSERTSVIEENFAAARVQQAFHRYLLRKEQLRLAQRQEKANAVLEIQRSYRGYKARQRMLHRRAVQQVIAKRRKEAAAVELLQANVRTFLLKKRREQKYLARHQAALDRLRQERARLAERLVESQAATSPRSNALHEGGDRTHAAADAHESPQEANGLSGRDSAEPAESSGETQNQHADDLYARLLTAMTELSTTVSTLRLRPNKRRESTRRHRLSATPAPNAQTAASETQTTQPIVPSQPPEDDSTAEPQDSEKDDEQRVVGEAIGRAEALARSFTALLATLKQSLVASEPRASSAEGGEEPVMSKTTSTSSLLLLEHPLARARTTTPMSTRPGTRDGAAPTSDWLKEAMAASFIFMDDSPLQGTSRQPTKRGGLATGRNQSANQADGDADDDDDDDRVVVDDVLWHSLEYTPRTLSETRLISRRLRLLLSSREDRRRLVTLKQFISDVYDTLVGRLRELPPSRWSRLVLSHCSLAMSFADAERFLRRQSVGKRATGATFSAGREPVTSFVALDLPRLLREHFQCQVGLKHLVDEAMASFITTLHRLADVDPDVKRFLGFLTAETPQEELVFFCVCRTLAADSVSRQPVFEDTTMREIIDSEHAMAIATSLFHADAEANMIAQDALVVEPSNEIYQRHLPSTCLSQLQFVLRQLVPGPDDSGATMDDDDDGSGDVASPESLDEFSPQLLSLLTSASSRVRLRATNANHFHASVYNASAPRSPLMRQTRGPNAANDATALRWLYFDDIVDLLRRYRVAMRHFHAFVRWARELFEVAVGEQAAEEARLFASAHPSLRRPHDVPLLEESAFVRTLAPYSLAASERELHNVFHNALKQRHLQRVMPLRVFVSVVIVLLRNGFLSVSSYQPLQRRHDRARKDGEQARSDGASAQTYRLDQEEAQWRQLALRWRGQEQRFEAAIEAIYAERDGDDASTRDGRAMELLQARNELYELLMAQSGRASLQRAREVLSLLVTALDRIHHPQSGTEDEGNDDDRDNRRERLHSLERIAVDATQHPQEDDVVSPAEAVGSPWDQEIS
ncbi:hypothetical protein PINS_up002100 [Pythium insidiosum]|nr:hypothetical protein PINS_up002100 [Pythium insidiosum]